MYTSYSPTSSGRTPTNRVVTTRRGTCRRHEHTARFSPITDIIRIYRDEGSAVASRLKSWPVARLRISGVHEVNPLYHDTPLLDEGGCLASRERTIHPHRFGSSLFDVPRREYEDIPGQGTTLRRLCFGCTRGEISFESHWHTWIYLKPGD